MDLTDMHANSPGEGKEVTVVSFSRARPGYADQLGKRLQPLVHPTRSEPGCIDYDLHRSNDAPAIWMLYENWRSAKDHDEHFKTSYFEEFVADLGEVLEGDMDIRRFAGEFASEVNA